MTFSNALSSRVSIFLFAGSISLLSSNTAHALRVSNFSGAAQNVITSNLVKEGVESNCVITITNVSDTPQAVRFSIKLFAQQVAGAGTCTVGGAAASCSGTGTDYQHGATITNATLGLADPLVLAANTASITATNCTAASNVCTLPMSGTAMTFPVINANSIVTQNVRCEGYISVENGTAGSPGYILATGNLSTFVESIGGAALTFDMAGNPHGTGKNNTTAPTITPIMIGEGRPF